MDDNITSKFNEILNSNGVSGVVCTDSHGLILKQEGNISTAEAGAISSIAMQASKLFPDLKQAPVISLEGTRKNCMIRQENKIVLGVFKDK